MTPLGFRNPQVQRLRRLLAEPRARRAAQAFVVEGAKLVADALGAGAPVEAVYVAAGWEAPLTEVAQAQGVPVIALAPGVVERVASTVAPQPVLAVIGAVDVELAALAGATLVVVCVDVRDPGNLGTVLRSALAAGASGAVCCARSADAYSPKCVRASAGAVLHLPTVCGGAVTEVLEVLGAWGMTRLGTRATGGKPYDSVDLQRPTALVLGNEGHGLPPAVQDALDEVVTIPMAPPSESLNVGAAAAVLCFEAARQRRTAGWPARGSSHD
ncbi:MAG: TrmH family RNA methyltransferase [Acidimicrobiales bacterium]